MESTRGKEGEGEREREREREGEREKKREREKERDTPRILHLEKSRLEGSTKLKSVVVFLLKKNRADKGETYTDKDKEKTRERESV